MQLNIGIVFYESKRKTYKEDIQTYLGFEVENKGKTSGSRIKFYNEKLQMQYLAHKPHPSSVMKEKALKDILNYLTKNQLI